MPGLLIALVIVAMIGVVVVMALVSLYLYCAVAPLHANQDPQALARRYKPAGSPPDPHPQRVPGPGEG